MESETSRHHNWFETWTNPEGVPRGARNFNLLSELIKVFKGNREVLGQVFKPTILTPAHFPLVYVLSEPQILFSKRLTTPTIPFLLCTNLVSLFPLFYCTPSSKFHRKWIENKNLGKTELENFDNENLITSRESIQRHSEACVTCRKPLALTSFIWSGKLKATRELINERFKQLLLRNETTRISTTLRVHFET